MWALAITVGALAITVGALAITVGVLAITVGALAITVGVLVITVGVLVSNCGGRPHSLPGGRIVGKNGSTNWLYLQRCGDCDGNSDSIESFFPPCIFMLEECTNE